IDALRKSGDPWVALVEPPGARDISPHTLSESLSDSLVKAATDGSLHAAMRYMELTPLANDKERDQFEKVASVIEKAEFRDDRVYVQSENFSRITKKHPPRRDLAAARRLQPLPPPTKKAKGSENRPLQRAKQIMENVNRLILAVGRGSAQRQPLPHRL